MKCGTELEPNWNCNKTLVDELINVTLNTEALVHLDQEVEGSNRGRLPNGVCSHLEQDK